MGGMRMKQVSLSQYAAHNPEQVRLNTIKGQVKKIYDMHPQTVHSDRALISLWLEMFHGIRGSYPFRYVTEYFMRNKITLDSVTRAGRWWRANFQEEYHRDENITKELEEMYKKEFERMR